MSYIRLLHVYRAEPPIYWMIVTEQRRTLELLVAAGLTYSKQDTVVAFPRDESRNIMSWLDSLLETPKSLKDISRLAIRTTLTEQATRSSIMASVDLLGLPATLSRYLLLDVDSLWLSGTKVG